MGFSRPTCIALIARRVWQVDDEPIVPPETNWPPSTRCEKARAVRIYASAG